MIGHYDPARRGRLRKVWTRVIHILAMTPRESKTRTAGLFIVWRQRKEMKWK
jgi:hypothetical protein